MTERKRLKGRDWLFQAMADELNELAGYIERKEMLPNRTPSAPSYWFHVSARELSNLRGTSWEEKLTPKARELFAEYVPLPAPVDVMALPEAEREQHWQDGEFWDGYKWLPYPVPVLPAHMERIEDDPKAAQEAGF